MRMKRAVLFFCMAAIGSAFVWWGGLASGEVRKENAMGTEKLQVATFAAGCFWGVEESFRLVPGVVATRVGFTGGTMQNPTYNDVCSDRTGHAEAVEVQFDPAFVSFDALLEVFWKIHDPTTINRQGPDTGSQYRSVIFFHDQEQEKAARASIAALEKSGRFKRAIVTQVVPAQEFYPAEEYHQKYFKKRGISPTCHIP